MKKITTLLTAFLLTSITLTAQDVYVAGIEYTNEGSVLVPTLWENGTQQSLGSGSSNTYAGSVFVSGSDVYVAGYESNGTRLVATLWKNGVAQDLTDGTVVAVAYSVFVYGSDVYVAGSEDDSAILWKNGIPINLSGSSGYGEGFSVFVTGSLGTGDISKNNFTLYPNPAQDVLNIQAIEPTTLQLYSLQGRLLQEIEADQNTQVDISGLASGIYFLKEMNGSTAYKVIKE